MKKIRMLAMLLLAVIVLESTGWTGLQPVAASQAAVTGGSTYSSITSAGKYLRKQLKARASTISFQFDTRSIQITDTTFLYNQILEEALKPTKDPQEGDYIRFHLARLSPPSVSGADIVIYKMHPSYITKASQEKKVLQRIHSIVASLNLANCSDGEKIKKIHDYLCKNVNYYDNGVVLGAKSCHSAYSALFGKRQTVCQGYATAFYALCMQAGISARCIQGIAYPHGGSSGNHLWNIVKLSGRWYNIDLTWDGQTAHSSGITYGYFLKNNADFNKDHKRFYYYNNANQKKRYYTSAQITAFNADCPMSAVSYTNSVGKPTIRGVVSAGHNAMRLKWNQVDMATGYYFYYATSQTDLNSCRPVVIRGGNVTSLKMVGLMPGTTYFFKMRAYSNLVTNIKSIFSATIKVKY